MREDDLNIGFDTKSSSFVATEDPKAPVEIRPQKGFQENALSCSADVAIIGGAAGAGKSWCLVVEPLRFVDNKNFGAIFFRRNQEQIKNVGGLLDESKKWYYAYQGELKESRSEWVFKSGARITFKGIEYEKDLLNFQGSQIPVIIFDELTHFTEAMFIYMLSRNRGQCAMNPYVRGSCNPDPDSWVANVLEWYIDQETGDPIPERDGVLRYFTIDAGRWVWGNSKKEVIKQVPHLFEKKQTNPLDLVKSFTFIAGNLMQNKILLKSNPGYLANLMAQSDEDRAMLLYGNWKKPADKMQLFDSYSIDKMFQILPDDDFAPIQTRYDSKGNAINEVQNDYSQNRITCDAAKFGQDLAPIFVWKKRTVVHITVFHLSSPQDLKNEIELLRSQFGVLRKNVLVDQDGIGGEVVKLGGYYGFSARRPPSKDKSLKGLRQNYKSRKDECAFMCSDAIKKELNKIIILPSTIKIYDKGSKNPRFGTKINWKGEMVDIKTMIKRHILAVKKGDTVMDGGEFKYCINSKEEQKLILSGDSPDFFDVIMMFEDFFLSRGYIGSFGVSGAAM